MSGGWHCGDLAGQPARSGAFGGPAVKDGADGGADGQAGDLVGHEHAGGACSLARACVVELVGPLRHEHERQPGGERGERRAGPGTRRPQRSAVAVEPAAAIVRRARRRASCQEPPGR